MPLRSPSRALCPLAQAGPPPAPIDTGDQSFHMEGGMGTTSKVVKLQLRPDPLAM